MHPLRSARFLARLVLAWFVLSLGVAIASPVVQPRGLDFICVGAGMKLLQTGDDGEAVPASGLDCPLCSTAAAPPPAPAAVALLAASHERAPSSARSAPPAHDLPVPPARGPPARETA
ncbi:hypothetical protein HK414_26955 [Ramlibacter terrae]|uniref:DUF2946 domain-containing protein n=1 Tax=Ramlibacter terrae TaxID=2732511 RepID=A0ABX6P891_9BURK|nr:hypothetical protein HK414_26955 [Ramlibacter terrae]